jgi:hypothetical protein
VPDHGIDAAIAWDRPLPTPQAACIDFRRALRESFALVAPA